MDNLNAHGQALNERGDLKTQNDGGVVDGAMDQVPFGKPLGEAEVDKHADTSPSEADKQPLIKFVPAKQPCPGMVRAVADAASIDSFEEYNHEGRWIKCTAAQNFKIYSDLVENGPIPEFYFGKMPETLDQMVRTTRLARLGDQDTVVVETTSTTGNGSPTSDKTVGGKEVPPKKEDPPFLMPPKEATFVIPSSTGLPSFVPPKKEQRLVRGHSALLVTAVVRAVALGSVEYELSKFAPADYEAAHAIAIEEYESVEDVTLKSLTVDVGLLGKLLKRRTSELMDDYKEFAEVFSVVKNPNLESYRLYQAWLIAVCKKPWGTSVVNLYENVFVKTAFSKTPLKKEGNGKEKDKEPKVLTPVQSVEASVENVEDDKEEEVGFFRSIWEKLKGTPAKISDSAAKLKSDIVEGVVTEAVNTAISTNSFIKAAGKGVDKVKAKSAEWWKEFKDWLEEHPTQFTINLIAILVAILGAVGYAHYLLKDEPPLTSGTMFINFLPDNLDLTLRDRVYPDLNPKGIPEGKLYDTKLGSFISIFYKYLAGLAAGLTGLGLVTGAVNSSIFTWISFSLREMRYLVGDESACDEAEVDLRNRLVDLQNVLTRPCKTKADETARSEAQVETIVLAEQLRLVARAKAGKLTWGERWDMFLYGTKNWLAGVNWKKVLSFVAFMAAGCFIFAGVAWYMGVLGQVPGAAIAGANAIRDGAIHTYTQVGDALRPKPVEQPSSQPEGLLQSIKTFFTGKPVEEPKPVVEIDAEYLTPSEMKLLTTTITSRHAIEQEEDPYTKAARLRLRGAYRSLIEAADLILQLVNDETVGSLRGELIGELVTGLDGDYAEQCKGEVFFFQGVGKETPEGKGGKNRGYNMAHAAMEENKRQRDREREEDRWEKRQREREDAEERRRDNEERIYVRQQIKELRAQRESLEDHMRELHTHGSKAKHQDVFNKMADAMEDMKGKLIHYYGRLAQINNNARARAAARRGRNYGTASKGNGPMGEGSPNTTVSVTGVGTASFLRAAKAMGPNPVNKTGTGDPGTAAEARLRGIEEALGKLAGAISVLSKPRESTPPAGLGPSGPSTTGATTTTSHYLPRKCEGSWDGTAPDVQDQTEYQALEAMEALAQRMNAGLNTPAPEKKKYPARKCDHCSGRHPFKPCQRCGKEHCFKDESKCTSPPSWKKPAQTYAQAAATGTPEATTEHVPINPEDIRDSLMVAVSGEKVDGENMRTSAWKVISNISGANETYLACVTHTIRSPGSKLEWGGKTFSLPDVTKPVWLFPFASQDLCLLPWSYWNGACPLPKKAFPLSQVENRFNCMFAGRDPLSKNFVVAPVGMSKIEGYRLRYNVSTVNWSCGCAIIEFKKSGWFIVGMHTGTYGKTVNDCNYCDMFTPKPKN